MCYALKSNLASLKIEVDKLDIDKLKPATNNFATLSNVVKNDVVKKVEYDKLVTKVNGIDTTNFVLKTKYEKDGSDFEDKINKVDKKIPDVSDLVKRTDFNSKITEVEGKIPNISGLTKSSALTAVKNKIPDASSLVKKTDYDTKINEIENKIPRITGLATNSALTAVENKILHVSNLVTKTYFDVKLQTISDRVTENKTKDSLLDNELKKIKTFDNDYFVDRNYFDETISLQNTLVFQEKSIYFRRNTGVKNISGTAIYAHDIWKLKSASDQSLY